MCGLIIDISINMAQIHVPASTGVSTPKGSASESNDSDEDCLRRLPHQPRADQAAEKIANVN
ncbi:hypothetical protein BDW72DRAFT_188315 [Aspergillus terricola var. indicus]